LRTLTIVRAVPSASIAPFTVTFMPLLLKPLAASARLIAADCVSADVKGVAIAAPATAAATPPPPPPPVGVELDPVDTLGTLIVGTDEVVVTLGTDTFGTLIVGAVIFETLGKNGTEL
jgi:hypothetical protein